MLVYGTGTKELGIKRIQGAKCPACESQSVHVIGKASYFHIFWIPILPYSKKVYPFCTNCDLEINKQDIDQRTVDKIKQEKKGVKIPIYLFSGIILIALLITYLINDTIQHEKKVANYCE